MKLIKLDAIDSTNDFLKGLSNDVSIQNYTVVTAKTQTNGKGQMGAKWVSESGKNLIVSVLVKNVLTNIDEIFDLNVAIALSIINVLECQNIPKLSIKWPNDIMSGNKKIAGILIENIIKSDNSIYSIIGIGLNVNQTNFDDLPNASSIKNIMYKDFDKEIILNKIIKSIQKNILELENNNQTQLWTLYNDKLFKKGNIMAFKNNTDLKFMGIIQQVSRNGKLQLLTENDILQEYDIKEILMIY